ncbi:MULTISPECIES: DUF192 domain-containing protein [Brevundimonas]|uniref:DUF192 domain-containing protein n=1 Tax=Brevundimonas TaxID=41275 RepID=UPI0019072FE7|nr:MULTISPECIES: DUF192 domain-containing protein [Brevundimonas]MBK1969391.1 DUF192 domain-containing protein [Brevundimonas diminuta]MBK1975534.1 DUF192 domain-containing protein [Brevundimonas diminuta]MDA0743813.1 DUF192 domain-containing protein [Pseudomonadota bacterium]MDM8353018.1 DUF192 domain-containing protein [Brevundimonas diminuta]
MIRRRVVVRITLYAVVLSGVLMASACTRTGPMDASGQPLEALSVVTASGEHKFMVEIADDDAERARGLMFRPPLEDDRGMLFQFQTASEQSFWMKNTPSSLDIIYIDPRGRIVSIASHATPNSEAPIPSNGAANGVLELRAGRAGEIGAKPGDTIKHPFFRP